EGRGDEGQPAGDANLTAKKEPGFRRALQDGQEVGLSAAVTMPVAVAIALALTTAVVAIAPALVAVFPLGRRLALWRLIPPLLHLRGGVLPLLLPTLLVVVLPLLALGLVLLPALLILVLPLLAVDLLLVAPLVVGLALAVNLVLLVLLPA